MGLYIISTMRRPIVFTVDNKYIRPLAVVLESLKRTLLYKRKVIIVHENLSIVHQKKLQNWLNDSFLDLEFVCINSGLSDLNLPHHFTTASLLRLIMIKYLPYPEVIYIDADALVCGDFTVIDNIRLDKYILAACIRKLPRDLTEYGFCKIFNYFESGFLIINCERFLFEEIDKKSIELIKLHDFDYPDQDALNVCCLNWLELPTSLILSLATIGDPVKIIPKYTVVFQFPGSNKPWHPFNNHPARKLFADHLYKTPYKFSPPGLGDFRVRSLIARLWDCICASSRRAISLLQPWKSG